MRATIMSEGVNKKGFICEGDDLHGKTDRGSAVRSTEMLGSPIFSEQLRQAQPFYRYLILAN